MKRWRLIRARLIRNMSIADMAKLSGISSKYYRQIEAGKRNPSLITIYSIMRVLDNTDIYLLRILEE